MNWIIYVSYFTLCSSNSFMLCLLSSWKISTLVFVNGRNNHKNFPLFAGKKLPGASFALWGRRNLYVESFVLRPAIAFTGIRLRRHEIPQNVCRCCCHCNVVVGVLKKELRINP